MTDHAHKAAREIQKYLGKVRLTPNNLTEIEGIVSQAIQEAAGPYREALEREVACCPNCFGEGKYQVTLPQTPVVFRDCARCAESRKVLALLPKETK